MSPMAIIPLETLDYLVGSLEDSSIVEDTRRDTLRVTEGATAEDTEICREEEDTEGREDGEGGDLCPEVWEDMGSFLIQGLGLAHSIL